MTKTSTPICRCRKVYSCNNVFYLTTVGMQGQIWTETIRTSDQLEYMAAPRILALAERAWHRAEWEDIEDQITRDRERDKDWEEFANTLAYRELGRLDKMDIKYRIPPPGAE